MQKLVDGDPEIQIQVPLLQSDFDLELRTFRYRDQSFVANSIIVRTKNTRERVTEISIEETRRSLVLRPLSYRKERSFPSLYTVEKRLVISIH